MKNPGLLKLTLFVLLGYSISSVSLYAQNAGESSHAEAEQSIRKILYEHSMATLTGDAERAWSYTAQRVVKLYNLVFEVLGENKNFKEQASQKGMADGKGFFAFSMQAAAKQFESMPKEKIEELAREHAESPITFINDKEATVQAKGGAVRAVLENDGWKIDSSEALKKGFLQVPTLTKAGRDKIEKY